LNCSWPKRQILYEYAMSTPRHPRKERQSRPLPQLPFRPKCCESDPCNSLLSRRSVVGQERRFRDVRGKSGLPPTAERSRQRSEPTLRAKALNRLRDDLLRGELGRGHCL
jgi:hypothetical protein